MHSSFGAGLARRRTTCPCLRPWQEWMFERPSILALSKHGVYCLIIIFSFNGNFWWMPYFLRKVNLWELKILNTTILNVKSSQKMGKWAMAYIIGPPGRVQCVRLVWIHTDLHGLLCSRWERFSTQPGRNGNGSEILNHENASLNIQIIQNGGSNMFD